MVWAIIVFCGMFPFLVSVKMCVRRENKLEISFQKPRGKLCKYVFKKYKGRGELSETGSPHLTGNLVF